MYSESDLASAVEAGAISPEAAEALRNHVAQSSHTPAVDEEHFRLLTGFNDIFVAIATLLILVAAGRIGGFIGQGIVGNDLEHHEIGAMIAGGGITVAVTSWLLAEYFTRRRRMALPSIILLLGFVGGIAASLGGLFTANFFWLAETFHIPETEMGARSIGGGGG
jgi:MFS family permease